jgi:3-methyladenine DNA glycosylase AlkD
MDSQIMTAAASWVEVTVGALTPLADSANAVGMAAYMKGVAPFLGLKTSDRRSALKGAWSGLPAIDEHELVAVCDQLWALPEREFQYAACDLIDRYVRTLSPDFIVEPVQRLLTTTSWWDSVDSLGTAAVSPLTMRNPQLVGLMWQWLDSGDTWLIRAALQHQRGRKAATDFAVLYAMCDRHAQEREFWIAKAIGWALRDVTRWDPAGVAAFIDAHPGLSYVARREALRGLARTSRP